MMELYPILAETGEANILTSLALRMGVDGPKLLSQIVLFAAVALVLKRYAYGPVQKILDERQRKIEQALDNADRIQAELAEAEAKAKKIVQTAQEQAEEIIKRAHLSAEEDRQRRLQEAVQEVTHLQSKARDEINLQRERLTGELRRETLRLVVDITAKAVGRILTPEDQARLQEETLKQVSLN